jgi:hypothetical protein
MYKQEIQGISAARLKRMKAIKPRRDDLGVVEDRPPLGKFGSLTLSLTLGRGHSIIFNRSAKL